MQLNSESVLKGAERAPNRSLFYALGYTDEEINRPLIGVVSAYSEIVPGHAHLDKLAEAVKAGVRMAGGTPILVPSIGVCDGIAMGHIGMKYSLPSRELICDSVETMARAHGFDGLVLVPNCDKIVPGTADGRGPVEYPVHCRQRRADALGPAGHAPRFAFPDVRGGGELQGRHHRRRRAGRLHQKHLSRLRQLLGYVYGQQHELPVRSHWHGAARQRNHPCGIRGAHAAGKASQACASWIWCGTGCVPGIF